MHYISNILHGDISIKSNNIKGSKENTNGNFDPNDISGMTINGQTFNIKNITLKSNNTDFYPQRHLDITTAAGATEGTAVTTGYVYNPNVNIAIGEQSSYDFLLPPQPLAGNTLTVLVTVDDEVRFLNIAGLGSSLDAGAYYNVSLTITDIQMVLTNALTVNDYGTQGNTNFDYKYEMHN